MDQDYEDFKIFKWFVHLYFLLFNTERFKFLQLMFNFEIIKVRNGQKMLKVMFCTIMLGHRAS